MVILLLTTGIKGKAEAVVDAHNTAKAMGSGTLDVFATPAMVALMESAAYRSVASALEPGTGTVGTLMNIKHVAATPMGMRVTAESELIEVDGRRLVFSVQASDETGLIGTGTHERFIVADRKFMAKAESKRG